MSDNKDLKTNYEKDLTNLGISIKKGETEKSLELIEKIQVEHLFHPDENGRTHLQNAIRLEQNAVASALIRKKKLLQDNYCHAIKTAYLLWMMLSDLKREALL